MYNMSLNKAFKPSPKKHFNCYRHILAVFNAHTVLVIFTARCLIPAERSRVVLRGAKRWPFDVTDAMVPHGENVTFYCKHPNKQCSFTATQTCFDGKLQPPACYLGKPGPPAQTALVFTVSACG